MKKAFSKNLIRLSGAIMALLIALSVFCTAISAGAESALMFSDSETLTQGVSVSSNATSQKTRSIIAQGASVDIEGSGSYTTSEVLSVLKGDKIFMYAGVNKGWGVNTPSYYQNGTHYSNTSNRYTTSYGYGGNDYNVDAIAIPKDKTTYNGNTGYYTGSSFTSSTSYAGGLRILVGDNNIYTDRQTSGATVSTFKVNGGTSAVTITTGNTISMTATASNYQDGAYVTQQIKFYACDTSYSKLYSLGTTFTTSSSSKTTTQSSVSTSSLSAGTYYLYATVGSDYTRVASSKIQLTVNDPCSGPTLTSTASKTLTVGDTYTNTATCTSGTTVSYSSSNTGVATVDSTGKVTAVSKGTATITATCSHGSATYTVTVVGTIRIYVGVTKDWTTNWSSNIKVYPSYAGNNTSNDTAVVCTKISDSVSVNGTTLRMFYADVPESWTALYIGNDSSWVFSTNYGAPVEGYCYYIYSKSSSDTAGSCKVTQISSLTIPSNVTVGDSASVTSTVSKSNTSTGELTAGGTTYTITYTFTNTSTNEVTTNTTGSLSTLDAGTYKVTAVLSDEYTSMEYDNGDTVVINSAKDVEVVVPSISNGTFKFTYTNSSGTLTTATTAGTYTVKNGTDVTCEVTPNTNYYVSALSGITDSYTAVSGTVSKTKTSVKQGFTIACTISANPQVKVTVKYNNATVTNMATVTGTGYVTYNGTATVTVKPNDGYYISAVTGATVTPTGDTATITLSSVTADKELTVTLSDNPVVTVEVVDSSGNAISSGATVTNTSGTTSGNTVYQSVKYNSTATAGKATFTVGTTDGTKYVFSGYCTAKNTTSQLTTGSKTNYYVRTYDATNKSIAIDTVKANVTIYAVFIPVHKITINYTNLSSLTVNDSSTANKAVLYKASGASVTMVATAADYYRMKASSWVATNATLSLTNSNTTASFTMGSSDVTITITPAPKSYVGTGSWGSKLLTIDTSSVNGGGEWFAAKFATSSAGANSMWLRFTKVSDDSYVCVIPNGCSYVKFYRMAKNATAFTDSTSKDDSATVAWNITDSFYSVSSTTKYKLDFITGQETKISATAQ
jgi:hypothetical protein